MNNEDCKDSFIALIEKNEPDYLEDDSKFENIFIHLARTSNLTALKFLWDHHYKNSPELKRKFFDMIDESEDYEGKSFEAIANEEMRIFLSQLRED